MYSLDDPDAYGLWAQEHDRLRESDKEAIGRLISSLPHRASFSLVVTSDDLRLELAEDIRVQLYPNWELIAPTSAATALRDERAIGLGRDCTDPIGFFNAALARATGDFIIAVPADARLPAHALYEFAQVAALASDAELIFSDEDAVDGAGTRTSPRFKTGWDPDLMLGRDAVGALAAFRTATAQRLGGLRHGPVEATLIAEDALDLALYDFTLRLGEVAWPGRLRHLPAVLCHRATPEPIRAERNADASRAIIRRHLAETGLARATVEAAPLAPSYARVRRPLPTHVPFVSVIVPTRDRADMLARCAEGVLFRTRYDNLELIIVDNESSECETRALLARLSQDARVRVLPVGGTFNFSALNNAAASVAQGEILVLLNNDTNVIGEDWLTEMVSHAIRPEIGAVGAKLLYADDHVQHCGITLGPGWSLIHQLRRARRDDPGPGGELALTRSISAVTGACLALRKTVFEEVGGLDAVNLPIAFNDVDLCMRLGDHGYRLICTPFAELYHFESVTRGYDDTHEKRMFHQLQAARFAGLWHPMLDTDPYHNPNLTFLWESSEYAAPTRRWRPWYDGTSHPSVLQAERIYGPVVPIPYTPL